MTIRLGAGPIRLGGLAREPEPAPPPQPDLTPWPDRTGSVVSLSKRSFHRIAFTDWGREASPRAVVCVHGLSRQGRDFDALASRLAWLGVRVVCPDLPGRGASDPLPDPDDYALPQYAIDMTTLLAKVSHAEVDWVGTSLGGLIGIVLAGMPGSPIRRLVINDIGPHLPWSALRRLGDYLIRAPKEFASLVSAEAYLRDVHAPFGPLTDPQWRHLTRHSVRALGGGRYRLHYDPRIAAVFRRALGFNLDLWSYWDQIRCPVLVLRGTESDLLTARVADEMARRGPGAEVVNLPGIGHAPALMDEAQIRIITDWLERTA